MRWHTTDERKPQQNEFTCSICKGVFPKGQSDEEALKEKDILFPDLEMDELVIGCEPCYIKVMDFNEPGQKRYSPFIDKEEE